MVKKNLSIKELCITSIFTAIICVFSLISIPMPYGVPLTLQTFAIPLAGIVLGAKNGTLSTMVYILLGALGLPVFAGLTGGFGVVLGPTGGFILSFPIMALTAGLGAKKGGSIWLLIGLTAGTAINYLCGMIGYSLVTSSSINAAFAACVLPFIPTSVIKIFLAKLLGQKIKNVLQKGALADMNL